jgi:hypothetical protein
MKWISLLLMLAAISLPAHGGIVEFSTVPTNTFLSNPFAHEGLVFSSPSTEVFGDPSGFQTHGGPANAALTVWAADQTMAITLDGGGTFSLNAIDIAAYGPGQAGFFDVVFTGHIGASTVTNQFTVLNTMDAVDGLPVLEHFLFDSTFQGLDSVTLVQGIYNTSSAWQFTNVAFNNISTEVPEPTSMTLGILAALASLAFARKRR